MAPMNFGARPVSYVAVLTALVVASEVLEVVPDEHPAINADPIVSPAAAVVISTNLLRVISVLIVTSVFSINRSGRAWCN